MSDFYQEKILAHYQNPHHFGKPKQYTHFVKKNNPLCGDSIEVYLKIKADKVLTINYEAKGCAISIAASSILSDFLKNKTKEAILEMKAEDLLQLLQIQLTPTRLKCALLPLEAIQACCDDPS